MILLLIILLPFICAAIARIVWPHRIQWVELAVAVVVSVAISASIYGLGLVGQTNDTEVINGQVTAKSRDHGHYLQSYSCRCKTRCSGAGKHRSCSTSCDTCYEDRYTVSWNCKTTLGEFSIQHLDRGSRSVYLSPDPTRYTIIQPGDPVAKTSFFTNYVKAAPDSLYHKNTIDKFKTLIPAYPDNIYDIYRIDRALAMGVNVPELPKWNADISNMLRELGPLKQLNAIILFVNTSDSSYIHALEGAWNGGKKNDVIVVIGTTSYPKIDWVRVSSWTDSQLFKVQLRDEITSQGTIDRQKIIHAIDTHARSSYKRKLMKDFEYLAAQIEPPTWVLILSAVLGILISVGASYYFYLHDPFTTASYGRKTFTTRRFR